MERLIRTDRNGTKYYECEEFCAKCKGTGYIQHYQQIYGGVCFECNGTGVKKYTRKVYTPEYEKKLAERARVRTEKLAEKYNAEFLRKNGFNENGKKYVVLGKTYEIKEELKAKGAKYDSFLHWCFPEKVEGYELMEVDIWDIAVKNGFGEWQYDWFKREELSKIIKESFKGRG